MILKMEKLKIKRKDVIELLKNEAIPDLEPMNICETMIKNEIISEERGYKNILELINKSKIIPGYMSVFFNVVKKLVFIDKPVQVDNIFKSRFFFF